MSDSEKPHGATTIRASKGGGGGGKWLLGAAAAAVLLGGGYFAYKNMNPAPGQNTADIAYNEPYGSESTESSRVGPLEDQSAIAETASSEESTSGSTASETARSTPTRRSTAVRTAEVPEETIGITPVSATTSSTDTDSDEIVVTGQRRPVWVRTPTQRRLSALYPTRALERGREGEASLHCVVQAGGGLGCEPVSATPGGFSTAALRVARTFRHSSQLADGSDATGSPVNLRVVFRIDDSQHG